MSEPGTAVDVAALVERIQAELLGGPRRYNREETAERAGVDVDEAQNLWRALGFASTDDTDRAFTDADVAALQRVRTLGSELAIDDELMRAITRMIGRSFARLASWQGQLLGELLGRSPELLRSENDVLAVLGDLLKNIEALHSYVWRRQLAAYLDRVLQNTDAADGAEATMAVGFADMAAFTTLTRRSSEAELRGVLESFERLTTDVVGANGGQVVKAIGDEILFTADDPRAAAEIALSLLDGAEADESLPPLRVGLASGPVVSRLGDVFGQTVNIASRLTSVARAGSVLVDTGMSGALDGDPRYRLRALRPISVRGYHHLRAARLRRADAL